MEGTAPTKMKDLQQQIVELAEEGKVDRIEDLWLELIAGEAAEAEFYITIVNALSEARRSEAAHDLLALALGEMKEKGEWAVLNRLVGAVAPKWPQSEELRVYAIEGLRARFADDANFADYLAATKLRDSAPIDEGLRTFREYLRLAPGQVYRHSSWGTGIVQSFDLLSGKVVYDFPTQPNKTLTVEGVRKYLTFLSPDHFLARRAKDPDSLRELGERDPAALIKLAFEGVQEGLKQSELKELLLDSIIAASRWSSWWNKARQQLRHDPNFDFPSSGGAHAVITMRDKPRTVEEDLEELFFLPEATFGSLVAGIRKFVEAKRLIGAPEEVAGRMRRRLNEVFDAKADLSQARRLEYAILCDEIESSVSELDEADGRSIPSVEAVIADWTDYGALAEVENESQAAAVLARLLERDGESGPEKAARLLPASGAKLAQAIWKALDGEKHRELAGAAIDEVFDDPEGNPPVYLWAVKNSLAGNWKHLEDHLPMMALVSGLLKQLERWLKVEESSGADDDERAAAKKLSDRVLTLLAARGYAAICEAAEAMTLEQATRLRQLIGINKALTEKFKSEADRQLRLTRRDFESEAQQTTIHSDIQYCTARARLEATLELRHLTSVKIPANSKAIEVARDEGDLKENAGYHAAKDEQKILMQKALQLQEALANTQVVAISDVNTGSISFGTAFEVENLESNTRESFMVLGRWEADAERNILSIEAPFAKQFLSKKVGDEFEVDHPGGGSTPFRVLAVGKISDAARWDSADDLPSPPKSD